MQTIFVEFRLVNSDKSEGQTQSDFVQTTRTLSADERAELARIARIVRVKPLWIAIPLTLWFWPVIIASVVARRFPTDLFLIAAYVLLGVMTVYWEGQVFVGAKLSKRLLQDREAGRASVEGGGRRETLPISGMDWIVDGVPAAWRGHPPTAAE